MKQEIVYYLAVNEEGDLHVPYLRHTCVYMILCNPRKKKRSIIMIPKKDLIYKEEILKRYSDYNIIVKTYE